MVRHISVDILRVIPQGMIVLGNDYRDGHVISRHEHRHGQLISGSTGTIILSTDTGTWVMPPQRGLWIPPSTMHDVQIAGDVRMQSVFVSCEESHDLPKNCQVVEISAFLQTLIDKALDLPIDYQDDMASLSLMNLIHHEMRSLSALPLSLNFPTNAALNRRCKKFLVRPDVHEKIEDWATSLGMSRRSFTRLFRRETGLSFLEWRQQACLVWALPRLAAGESVTKVAGSLGYDNPAAFTTMFKQRLGAPPRQYLRHLS